MNKLKLLIPTLSVATVATGIFTTTSCSKSDVVEMELTQEMDAKSQHNAHYIYINQQMDFVNGTKYIFDINMEKFDIGPKNVIGFFLSKEAPKMLWDEKNTTPIQKLGLQIDGKKLMEVPRDFADKTNAFWLEYMPEDNMYGLQTGEVTINNNSNNNNSKIKIEFEVVESIKKYYPITTIWYEE